MYLYTVVVKANLPYPVEKEYKIKCWKLWTAISRGIKLFRAEPSISRKKLSDVSVKGYRVAKIEREVTDEERFPEVEEAEETYEEQELDPQEKKRIEDEIAKTTINLQEPTN